SCRATLRPTISARSSIPHRKASAHVVVAWQRRLAPMPPSPSLSEARALYRPTPDKTVIAARDRVLDALKEIIKFETDPVFAKLAQRRFLDITDGEHHVQHRA